MCSVHLEVGIFSDQPCLQGARSYCCQCCVYCVIRSRGLSIDFGAINAGSPRNSCSSLDSLVSLPRLSIGACKTAICLSRTFNCSYRCQPCVRVILLATPRDHNVNMLLDGESYKTIVRLSTDRASAMRFYFESGVLSGSFRFQGGFDHIWNARWKIRIENTTIVPRIRVPSFFLLHHETWTSSLISGLIVHRRANTRIANSCFGSALRRCDCIHSSTSFFFPSCKM